MYSCTETRPEVDGCVVSAFGSGRGQELVTVQENHRFNRGIKAIIDRDSGFSCISLLMGDKCAKYRPAARQHHPTRTASGVLILYT